MLSFTIDPDGQVGRPSGCGFIEMVKLKGSSRDAFEHLWDTHDYVGLLTLLLREIPEEVEIIEGGLHELH